MVLESVEQYSKSVDIYITYIHGEQHFIDNLKARMDRTGLADEYSIVTDSVYNLHKMVYGLRAWDIDHVKSFEDCKIVAFLTDFDTLCYNSTAYTRQEFHKELGKRLNRLIKEYNKELIYLKGVKSTLKLKPQIQEVNQLTFVVNQIELIFNQDDYMNQVKSNRNNLGKLFDNSLPWAVTQYPDPVVNKGIRDISSKHRMLSSYIDSDWDQIISFESLATCFFLDLIYKLVTIPQNLANTPEKYIEVTLNLRSTIEDYRKALDKILDKVTKKQSMQTNSQVAAFSQIVDSML